MKSADSVIRSHVQDTFDCLNGWGGENMTKAGWSKVHLLREKIKLNKNKSFCDCFIKMNKYIQQNALNV